MNKLKKYKISILAFARTLPPITACNNTVYVLDTHPHTKQPVMTNELHSGTCAPTHIQVAPPPKVHFDLQLSSALLQSVPGDSAR